MAPPFNPRRVIRNVSRDLIKEFFESEGCPLDIDWTAAPGVVVNAIFDGWQNLEAALRKRIEVAFQDVHAMANDEGIEVIFEEGAHRKADLTPLQNPLLGRYDKALWTLMHRPKIWDAAIRFAEADTLSEGRSWVKRGNLPNGLPRTTKDTMDALGEALTAFFVERLGKGHYRKVEYFPRGTNDDYFFVYLSDYASVCNNFDDTGEFMRTSQRRAFEVVFALDREALTLAIYAKGGKQIIEPLQSIFSRVILGADLPPENEETKAYYLDGLMDSKFGFPTDPEDGVEETAVRYLRLSILGRKRGRITLEPDPEAGRLHIYEMLEQDLNRKRLSKTILRVTKATINMKLNGNGCGRSLAFSITHPSSCNLKNKREEQRLLGEKYLRRWGIDVA